MLEHLRRSKFLGVPQRRMGRLCHRHCTASGAPRPSAACQQVLATMGYVASVRHNLVSPSFCDTRYSDAVGLRRCEPNLVVPDPDDTAASRAATQASRSAVHCRSALEWILRPVDPEMARRWADRLIDDFGSLGNVLETDEHIVTNVLGGAVEAARRLLVFKTVMTHALRCHLRAGPVFRCWNEIIDYLMLKMARLPVEELRVLFLDSALRLMADEVLWTGTIDEVACYARQVARRATVLNATGVIVVHNHPRGNPKMSHADVSKTHELDRTCRAVGVRLYDHLVIASEGYSSFRQDNPLWARS